MHQAYGLPADRLTLDRVPFWSSSRRVSMPVPASMTRVNRRIVNPVTSKFAGSIPPFSMLDHVGRKGHMPYRTPIMAFRSSNEFIIALTYGPNTDWVRNVIAAGGCSIEHRRRHIELTDPEHVQSDPAALPFPWLVQKILHALQVKHFLTLTRAQPLEASGTKTGNRPAERPG
jgi:deazaflavin-dependent oxidoreductase (nitroreductase family)